MTKDRQDPANIEDPGPSWTPWTRVVARGERHSKLAGEVGRPHCHPSDAARETAHPQPCCLSHCRKEQAFTWTSSVSPS